MFMHPHTHDPDAGQAAGAAGSVHPCPFVHCGGRICLSRNRWEDSVAGNGGSNGGKDGLPPLTDLFDLSRLTGSELDREIVRLSRLLLKGDAEGRDALVGVVREALIASPVIPLGDEPYVGWSHDLAVTVVDALFGVSRLEES